MHYTLHLSNNCNMGCGYCYVNHQKNQIMSIETSRKAVNMAEKQGRNSIGIVFFGGEPLLYKELIYETVDYCRWKEKQSSTKFHFKVTTNGLLLDEAFMDFSMRENVFIAMSHDGIKEAHDRYRLDREGHGTFARVSDKISLLLSKRPYAPILMVVNPDTGQFLADSVLYLYEKGFRYIIPSLNYGAQWMEKDMRILKGQYERLASFYLERTLAEDKFYLSPFEVKISSHINEDTYCQERCELGKKQVSVAPNGYLFPCVQFIEDMDYCIGHVDKGIDIDSQDSLYLQNEKEKQECKDCAIRKRCNHFCGCMNKQSTGSIHKVSPTLCHHERLLLPIADRLAEKLFKKRSAMFIQKHYNDMFPILSLIEDEVKEMRTKTW